ncbi:MAG: acyltransferase [Actinomyces sp.]|nr:MAG: acyltransferase [Actinomyces sp.]
MTVPPPARRRLLTVPGLLLATLVGILVTPPVALGALAADLVTRRWQLRWFRLWFLALGVAGVEALGTLATGVLWVRHAPGGIRSPASVAAHHRLQMWWVRAVVAVMRRTIALRYEVDGVDLLGRGHAVVLARHASHLDAMLPAWLFGVLGDRRVRYVLKEDLQWSPALDTVAKRLPNVFVDRSPVAGSEQLAHLHRLARDMDDDSVCVIFPEGTFYTPTRRDRAVARLARTRPDLEALARRFRHILPPRPAGTLALLDGAPDADVVIVGHVGLEGFASLAEISRSVPLRHPVHVRVWRHRRSELPTERDDIITWIVRRWLELDDWIDAELARRRAATDPGDRPDGPSSDPIAPANPEAP